MTDLYLFSYNNYYNRSVKKEETLEGYGEVIHSYSCNFKEGDGINTKMVANFSGETIPDYAVLAEGEIIISRWFIIDCRYIRKGQYELTLHRDVIADNLENTLNATCFIEKATVKDSDPLIFNEENMSFSQIKQKEELLKDETNCGWIVGYVAPAVADETDTTIKYNTPINYDLETTSLDDWEYNIYTTNPLTTEVTLDQAMVRVKESILNGQAYKVHQYNLTNGGITHSQPEGIIFDGGYNFTKVAYVNTDLIINTYAKNEIYERFDYYNAQNNLSMDIVSPAATINQVNKLKGKILRVGTTEANYQYYEIGIEKENNLFSMYIPTTNSNFFTAMGSYFNNMKWITGTAVTDSFQAYFYKNDIKIVLTPVSSSLEVKIPANRPMLEDAPYCMFAMPYGQLTYNRDSSIMIIDNDSALKMAAAIYTGLGSKCYDIQLLPYCPIRELLVNTTINIEADDPRYQEVVKTGSTTVYNFTYWCRKSSFTFNIKKEIAVSDEIKIQNETEFIRLNSPNYAAAFDFSVAKNNGVDYFNIDCSYKPYSPYIHLNPNFKNLYGTDFNDARGLILAGDFSIPKTSDAWTEYQLQNKNFQASFDRNIESLDFRNNYAKTQDIINAISGSVSGAASGAVTGGMAGGPAGAVAGAVVGGAASAIGGVLDVSINESLRNESRDLTIDQFNYNLGNIKALPNTLQKVGALNENNKIFPFIEFYSATEREKQILRDKIKWNGSRVEAIGTINEYLNGNMMYIKAKIIRINNIKDDFQLVNEISNELNKGVYFDE